MSFDTQSRDPAAWARALAGVEIPVLQATVDELARLREHEERVIARDISRVLMNDPMFTLRLLCFLQSLRRPNQPTEITTVQHALMMLGVSPFFNRFSGLPTVEAALADHPMALEGLLRVINRSRHAAVYAFDWAVSRHDVAAEEVVVATLLHDMAEMLLWCLAPQRALHMQAMLDATRSMRSSAAQHAELGFTLTELQVRLIAQWRLPALLQSLMDDTHANDPRAINVLLAVDLARHSAKGWTDPALPDDYTAIGRFLGLPEAEVLERVRRALRAAQLGSGVEEGPPGPPAA